MAMVTTASAEEIERLEKKDLDALQMLIIDDMEEYARKEEEEEEEEERRKRDPLGNGRKRKTETTEKKMAEATSGCKAGKVDASSGPAAAKADLATVKKSDGGEVEASGGGRRKKTTDQVDLAAAAVHRAEAEEADRKQQRKEKLKAVKKWLATGDPEARLYWKRWIAEEGEAADRAYPRPVDEDLSDPNAVDAQRFREFWDYVWARTCGSFEDTTAIGPMRFTDKKPGDDRGHTMDTLQVFSVRVAEIKEEIEWPIDVFGIIAARDCVDHNRNIIFDRRRDDCQTITKESPYLTLTGPTRAVIVLDPACLEVVLRVKGATESEDRDLSFLALWHRLPGVSKSFVVSEVEPSKLSTLELTFGHIVRSVEATISVKVIGAKLPDGFRGALTANTTSIDDQKVLLLAFGDDDESPVAAAAAADGMIQLLRRVVCVELEGELRVSVKAQCDEGQVVEEDYIVFKPKEASGSCGVLQVCSCKMEVTVAWSLLYDF